MESTFSHNSGCILFLFCLTYSAIIQAHIMCSKSCATGSTFQPIWLRPTKSWQQDLQAHIWLKSEGFKAIMCSFLHEMATINFTAAARWRWGEKLFLETHKSDIKVRFWFPQLKSVSLYLDISHLFVIFAHLKCLYHSYHSSGVYNVIKNIQIQHSSNGSSSLGTTLIANGSPIFCLFSTTASVKALSLVLLLFSKRTIFKGKWSFNPTQSQQGSATYHCSVWMQVILESVATDSSSFITSVQRVTIFGILLWLKVRGVASAL